MKNNSLKNKVSYIPEILLLIGGIFCLSGDLIYGSTSPITGIIILGILAVLTLVVWKNKYFALAFSIALGCVSVFFILAVLSEFRQFPTKSREGLEMLSIGGLIFGGLLAISMIIPKKYFKIK